MAKKLAEKIVARKEALATLRAPHESTIQEVFDYVVPRRGLVQGIPEKSQIFNIDLFDDTACAAAERVAAAIHGILTNAAVPWFSFRIPQIRKELREDEGIRQWLEDVRNIMYEELYSSNIDTQLHELYLDLITAGTACMWIGPGESTMLNFDTLHISEFLLDENRFGEVDTLFRCFKLTAREAIKMFAAEKRKLSSDVMKAAKDSPMQEFEFIHAVYPRTDVDLRKADAQSMPFASIYVEEKERKVLREGGFREFPYAVPRWWVASGEKWGRSLAMTAMPSIRVANEIAKTMLKAGQKQADPPLQAPDDGFLDTEEGVDQTPGSVNYYRAGTQDRIEILPVGDPAFSRDMLEYYKQIIEERFFLSHLQLIDQQYMTAQEVLQRTSDRDRALGPLLGRLRSEHLAPMLRRAYGIMDRAGAFPEPPPALAEVGEISVEYVSQLAKAQRLYEAQGIARTMEIFGTLWQTPRGERYMDGIDILEAQSIVMDVFAVPERVSVPVKQVKQQWAEEEQAVEQQQQMQMLSQGAEAAERGASAARQMAEAQRSGEE